jgi:hypothetical protein
MSIKFASLLFFTSLGRITRSNEAVLINGRLQGPSRPFHFRQERMLISAPDRKEGIQVVRVMNV